MDSLAVKKKEKKKKEKQKKKNKSLLDDKQISQFASCDCFRQCVILDQCRLVGAWLLLTRWTPRMETLRER